MNLLFPLICCCLGIAALGKRRDLVSPFMKGAQSGLKTLLGIFPSLLLLLPMIRVLRASGLLEALTGWLSPLLGVFGIPVEVAPILFLRPFSGSGALAAAVEIFRTYGTDSEIGRTAAVMLGSTETTFYVLTVYFGSISRPDTKRILPAALLADFVGFAVAAATVRWFFQ